VEQVFTSGDSGEPVFVTVGTGLFGMSESFAPLPGASREESVIRVALAKDTVKNGPRIDSDRGAIAETQEQELYSYYGAAFTVPLNALSRFSDSYWLPVRRPWSLTVSEACRRPHGARCGGHIRCALRDRG
jgi:hypothetical protein